MTTTEPWKRVGHAVRNQRLHLGWTQQEASERAGVSLATWRLIESAGRDRYQDLTIRGRLPGPSAGRIDTFATILAGGEAPAGHHGRHPTPAGPTPAVEHTPSGDARPCPSGFARKYLELTHREQAMLQGYLDALIDRRTRP